MAWGWVLSVLVVCGVCGGMRTLLAIVREGRSEELIPAQPVVIFGARVGSAGPSPAMRARVDRAAELRDRRPDSTLICCGTEPEIVGMRALLDQRGLASGTILDCRAASTREALRALRRIHSVAAGPIVAVSSPYHMHRIRVEGQRNGLHVNCVPSRIDGGATGRVSVTSLGSLAHLHLRELAASWWYALSSSGSRRERG